MITFSLTDYDGKRTAIHRINMQSYTAAYTYVYISTSTFLLLLHKCAFAFGYRVWQLTLFLLPANGFDGSSKQRTGQAAVCNNAFRRIWNLVKRNREPRNEKRKTYKDERQRKKNCWRLSVLSCECREIVLKKEKIRKTEAKTQQKYLLEYRKYKIRKVDRQRMIFYVSLWWIPNPCSLF